MIDIKTINNIFRVPLILNYCFNNLQTVIEITSWIHIMLSALKKGKAWLVSKWSPVLHLPPCKLESELIKDLMPHPHPQTSR